MLASALSLVGREALRIVLPSWCVACERELPWRERKASCCGPCWSALPKITGPKCSSCALPMPMELPVASDPLPVHCGPGDSAPVTVNGSRATLCIGCLADPLPLEWCDSWGEYRGPLERLLGALKFHRHDFLDDALASLLEETLRGRGDLAFDAIVGVPMPPAKERRRGYNQAHLLAHALSRRVGIGCDMKLLRRAGERATQSKLPKRERAANVRNAFAAASLVKGKSILVVDDICTTGETLRACATALLREGAGRVCAVTVAKAS
ncbi:MAG: phosphoribosyltransferase family protein [Thermoanaerobaculia bacterium]